MTAPKISVVIPCYNVGKYIRQCMDSVVGQTLKEIEIICVNDGSQDDTLSILREYERKDNRVRIIDKANSGYGHSMNTGFDIASGEYLGIVESDDFAELDMFEVLYRSAKENDLDVARGGFFQYTTAADRNVPISPAISITGKEVFCPMTVFADAAAQGRFFRTMPAIWSGIYRRSFIRENGIRFLETPGASYQDVGFCLKVWARADRVQLIDRCLLHYRVDNAQSSVHNPGKVYCICDEYGELERFLRVDPEEWSKTMPVLMAVKFENYIWNYERLSETLRGEFIQRFGEEFRRHSVEGILDKQFFAGYSWSMLQKLLLDPKRFHEIQSQKLRGEKTADFYDIYPQNRPVKSRLLWVVMEKTMIASAYMENENVFSAVKQLGRKIKRRILRK